MRIRLPFAGAFICLCLAAAYLGLTSLQLDTYINDKVLHTLTFFILTTCFYWILDTTRRRNLHITLLTCTFVLGIGSEVLQGFLDNGRIFDLYDIVANIVGSLAAVGICSWYHKRMLERKRLRKGYVNVARDDQADLELGEGSGLIHDESDLEPQESGVTLASIHPPTLDEEVDNWDENAEDNWDEDEPTTGTDSAGEGLKTPSASSTGDEPETKKRVD